jgi:hypothetical protein
MVATTALLTSAVARRVMGFPGNTLVRLKWNNPKQPASHNKWYTGRTCVRQSRKTGWDGQCAPRSEHAWHIPP